MKKLKKEKVWEINEFFHHKFSHFLITGSAVLIFFSFAMYELNRPSLVPLLDYEILILVISGILGGIVVALSSIEGRIAHSMFFLAYVLSIILVIIFIRFNLNFRLFPLTLFVETMYVTKIFAVSIYKYKKKGLPEIVPPIFFDD
jgi:hypothetical protein